MAELLIFIGFVLALLVALSTGVPVAVALGLVGAGGILLLGSPAGLDQLGTIALSQATSFALLVVPLFLLMSEVVARSRITAQLFETAQHWLGRIPGALAVASIFGATGFAAVCGSSPVTAATVGGVAIPEMHRQGYNRSLAFGAVAAGGTIGLMVPPSIVLILYGIITETSIGDLFIAAIIPGLLTAGLLSATVVALVMKNPSLAPRVDRRVGWGVRLRGLHSVIPVLTLFGVVMGVIYFGIATPAESAAVGAVGAIVIVLLLRELSRGGLTTGLGNAARTTAMFLLLVISGLFVAFMLTLQGVPQGVAGFVLNLDVSPVVVLLVINLALIILGMFIDPLSILVIMVPLLFPTVVELGYDPVWFGIMIALNIEIGMVTPPVGLNLFVLKGVIPDAGFSEIVRGAMWFIVPLLIGLGLLIAFPEIALFAVGRA